MPRRLVNRFLQPHRRLRDHWILRPFDALLHDPALWATHRKSVARACAIGFFVAFLPILGHMFIAALLALYRRVNLIVAMLATLIVNPLTIAPIFLGAYWLGNSLLGRPPAAIPDERSWAWFAASLSEIWAPLWLGSLILGTVAAAVGYFGINLLWRWLLVNRWRRRRANRVTS